MMRARVNAQTVLAVSGFWVAMVLGVYVLSIDAVSPSHRAFFAVAFFYSLWSLFAGFAFTATGEHELWMWFRIAATAGILFVSSCVWLALSLSRGSFGRLFALIVFGPSIPVHLRNWTSFFIFDRAVQVGQHWVFHVGWSSPWAWYWVGYAYSAGIAFSLLTWRWGHRSRLRRERLQGTTLAVAMIVYLCTSGPADYFLSPLLRLPPMSPLYFFSFLLAVFYAITRYRLLTITQATVSHDILQSIDQAVVLIDPGSRVVGSNRAADDILAAGRSLSGRSLAEAFGHDRGLEEGLADLLAGRRADLGHFSRTRMGSRDVTLELSARVVRDRFGDGIGVLLVGNPVRGVDQFRARFHVTRREWDTIQSLLAGIPSRAVARRLDVSERTVKAHIESIYRKLGVHNRVGLLEVLRRHCLLPQTPAPGPASAAQHRLLARPPED